jgi:hypothetical protein
MPTTLQLTFTAYATIKVPNALARKLKAQQPDSVQENGDKPFAFGNKWGDLFFQGANGKEYCIKGQTGEIDYKRTDDGEWHDEEDSDGENDDGTDDGLVLTAVDENEITVAERDELLGEEEKEKKEEVAKSTE